MARVIVVLDKKTNKVKHYYGIEEAATDLGFLRNQFYSAFKGKSNKLTAAGYLVYDYTEYYGLAKVREHYTSSQYEKYSRKAVYMLDPFTHEILDKFKSVREAARDLGVNNVTSIRKCCDGKCKTAHGYKWEWEYITRGE